MVCGVAFIVIAITAARIRTLYHDSVTVIATTCRVQNHRHTRPFTILVATVNGNGWNNRRPSRFPISITTERRLFSTIAFYTSYLPHTCRIRIQSYRDTRTEWSLTHFSPHYPLNQYDHFPPSNRQFHLFHTQQCTLAPWWIRSANFCPRHSTCRLLLWERLFTLDITSPPHSISTLAPLPSHSHPSHPSFHTHFHFHFHYRPNKTTNAPHSPFTTHSHSTPHPHFTTITRSTTHSPFTTSTSSTSYTPYHLPPSPNSIPHAPLPQRDALHSIYPVIYP